MNRRCGPGVYCWCRRAVVFTVCCDGVVCLEGALSPERRGGGGGVRGACVCVRWGPSASVA